jgi:hypothetical protein
MLERAKPYMPWILRGLALLLFILLAKSWNDARSLKNAFSKELEREKIEKAGLLAERDATKKELKDREAELLMGQAALAVEVERLKSTVGKVKIVEVIKWETKEVRVEVPVEVPGRDCPPLVDGKPSKKILLVEGDTGMAEVTQLKYETRAGNQVIVGQASCLRLTPTKLELFKSVIAAPVSFAIQTPEPDPYRWGAGAYFGFSQDGWAAGPSIAFPPLSIFSKAQAELTVGLGLGPKSNFQGGATGVVRWR